MIFLVVDDSPTIRRLVISTLRDFGFRNFIEAVDGSDALKKLGTAEVDIVITDWVMPIMDGISLVKEIRKDPELRSIPILMLTTKSDKKDVIEAIKEKINAYIVKPFNSLEFKRKLEPLLRARNAMIKQQKTDKSLKIDIKIEGCLDDDLSNLDLSLTYIKNGKTVSKKLSKFERDKRQPKISNLISHLIFDNNDFEIKFEIFDENKNLADADDFTIEK